jgi:hypothetical protein
MSDQNTSSGTGPTPPHTSQFVPPVGAAPFVGRVFIFSSVISLAAIVVILLAPLIAPVLGYITTPEEYPATLTQLIIRKADLILLFVVAIFCAVVGRSLVTYVPLSSIRTIPEDDFDLVSEAVREGKPEPIDQYVRLRGLTGFSGAFQKLGITGLPLTTVALTLIFSGISVAIETGASEQPFLDLAKLTLGAFIGSFVQRQVERRGEGDVRNSRTNLPGPT